MQIAHLIHGLGTGGAQRVVAILARQLREHRHTVYTPAQGVMTPELSAAGAAVRLVPQRVPKLDLGRIRALRRELAAGGFDVVHCHLFGDALHGTLANAGRAQQMVTLHNEWRSFTRLQRWGYRLILPRCDRVVACSEAVASSFRRALGARIVTIPNGIETSGSPAPGAAPALRSTFGIAPERPVIAALGRLEAEKDFACLLLAFAQIDPPAGPQPLLVLIGEGSLRSSLEQLAGSLAIRDRVLFAGFRSDARELIADADLFVLSSRHEGLPLALLEAMSAGLCVVTTEVPGVTEVVRPDQEALVVPVGDAAALAGALGRALVQPDLRRRLGEAAHRRFLAGYTAERMASSYHELYRGMVAATRSPAAVAT